MRNLFFSVSQRNMGNFRRDYNNSNQIHACGCGSNNGSWNGNGGRSNNGSRSNNGCGSNRGCGSNNDFDNGSNRVFIEPATVRIGSVSTGAPGSNASVTNTGTPTNAVLNFSIPRGADGVSSTNSDLACSRAQMRNVLSQIIRCFEDADIAITLYDGTRIENLRLLDVCPECNPVYLKVKNEETCEVEIYLIDAIGEVSVETCSNVPKICYIDCCSRTTNPIEAALCEGEQTELILAGNNRTDACIEKLVDGLVVSTSSCPNSINYTATAALVGFTVEKKRK